VKKGKLSDPLSWEVNYQRAPSACGLYRLEMWARGSVVVKALCYKPEGRGFQA
jgi:hypothetical protein